jgi:hypothetical protein
MVAGLTSGEHLVEVNGEVRPVEVDPWNPQRPPSSHPPERSPEQISQ